MTNCFPPSPDRAMPAPLRWEQQGVYSQTVATTSEVRLMLVDDHALVRMGLVALLQTVAGFRVVAEASDGAEALELFGRHQPEVTLLDIRLPRQDGIDILRQILARWPEARVIMLTTSDLDNDIERAVEAGAAGYLLKTITRNELVNAIRQVHAGEACIPEQVRQRLAACRLAPRLTEREQQVLDLLPKGLTNPDISRLLGISLHTTKTHLRTIFSKLDVVDRSEAITTAVQRGLLRLEE